MKRVNISDINNILENKDNKFLNVDGINTKDIEILIDTKLDEVRYNLSYIIASIISKDFKILDLIDRTKLSLRNKSELEVLYKFLKSSENGVMKFKSIRKDLLQFEIITSNTT